ncbi:hypothetical protein ACHAXR_010010 [Thalassiosira sp. AJA248-18]
MLSSTLLRFARSTTAPAAAAASQRLSAITTTAATTRRTLASAPAAAVASTTTAGSPPSVFDNIVKITIIDPSGARRAIPAMVGQTLYAACDQNGVDLGPSSNAGPQAKVRSSTWTEPLYGEGPTSGFDHVLLQGGNEGVKLAEPMYSSEQRQLEAYWDDDEIFPESRLASMVEIIPEMDGMVVYVPDRIVDDNP